jgi:hypothetical protein
LFLFTFFSSSTGHLSTPSGRRERQKKLMQKTTTAAAATANNNRIQTAILPPAPYHKWSYFTLSTT